MVENREKYKGVPIARTEEDFLFNRAVSIAGEKAVPRRSWLYRVTVGRAKWAEAIRHTPKAAISNYTALKWMAPLTLFALIVNMMADLAALYRGRFDAFHGLMTALMLVLTVYMYSILRKSAAVIRSFSDEE